MVQQTLSPVEGIHLSNTCKRSEPWGAIFSAVDGRNNVVDSFAVSCMPDMRVDDDDVRNDNNYRTGSRRMDQEPFNREVLQVS